MNKYAGSLAGLLLLMPAWISMPAQALFSADFQSGTLPAGVTAKNEGSVPASNCYRHGYTTAGWTVDRVGTKGYAAVSPTFTLDGSPTRNVLTLPAVTPGENAILRFSAISVYADFPDCLTVELYYPSTEERVMAMTIDNLGSEWTPYLLSLPSAGEEVEISLVTGEKPGYLAAVDDIFVGVPETPMYSVVSRPVTFFGKNDLQDVDGREGKAALSCTLFNAGSEDEGAEFRWMAGDATLSTDVSAEVISTGETFIVKGLLPVVLDEPLEYKLCTGDGENETVLLSGTVSASDYRRCLLVDEGTGMWCNNCPEGSLNLTELRNTFGKGVITLVTHVDDPLANPDYWSSLKFYAIPYFKLNRIAASAFSSLRNFPDYYWEPTKFGIEFTGAGLPEDGSGKLNVGVRVSVAEDMDVAEDAYGIGYVVTGNFSGEPDYYQKNNSTRATAGVYYYLPTNIPSPLVKFHDVTLTSENSFSPAVMIPAGTGNDGCELYLNIERPELLPVWETGNLTAYIIEKSTGKVMNAVQKPIAELLRPDSGINGLPSAESALDLRGETDGTVMLTSSEDGEVLLEVISIDGRVLMSDKVKLDAGERYRVRPETSGWALVRAISAKGTAVCKIFR